MNKTPNRKTITLEEKNEFELERTFMKWMKNHPKDYMLNMDSKKIETKSGIVYQKVITYEKAE